MTKIRFTFVDLQGSPLSNLQFYLLVKRASFNDEDIGVTLPERLEVVTDENGQAIVELWPLKTAYKISVPAEYEDMCGKLNWSFYVPKSTEIIDAQTLYLVPPPQNIPWDEEAIGKITQAVTDSQAAAEQSKDEADRAKSEADRAEVAAIGIGNAVQEAKDAATASEASAVRAENQVDLAADQVVLATQEVAKAAQQVELAKSEADRASAGAGSANNAAIAAGAARDAAVIAQGEAESSASAANTSQLVAKDSEQRAGASATATAADRAAVQSLADQVALDKLQTGQDRTVTVENAAEAKVARDEAVAAAATAQGAFVEGGLIDLSGGAYPPKPAQATLWQVDVGGTVDGVVYVKGDTLAYSKAQDTFYKQGGSGAALTVPEGDCNKAVIAGNYRTIPTTLNGRNVYGLLEVFDYGDNGNSKVQRLTTTFGHPVGEVMWFRAGTDQGGRWSPWHRLVSAGNYGVGSDPRTGAAQEKVGVINDANVLMPGGTYLVHAETLNSPKVYGTFRMEWYDEIGWTQTITQLNEAAVWVRYCVNGSIGDWSKIGGSAVKKWQSTWRTVTGNKVETFNHSLGARLSSYVWEARLKVSTAGYAAGTILTVNLNPEVAYAVGITVYSYDDNTFYIQSTGDVNATMACAAGTGASTYLPWANIEIRCIVTAA